MTAAIRNPYHFSVWCTPIQRHVRAGQTVQLTDEEYEQISDTGVWEVIHIPQKHTVRKGSGKTTEVAGKRGERRA